MNQSNQSIPFSTVLASTVHDMKNALSLILSTLEDITEKLNQIDPDNPNTMFAASKNGENKGKGRQGFNGVVVKSTDGGETWFEIMNGLERDREYYQLIMYPDNHDILFVSAWDGVYMTKNSGKSWESINYNLKVAIGAINNVANNLKLDASNRYLYLGTKGRGVYKADLNKLNLK